MIGWAGRDTPHGSPRSAALDTADAAGEVPCVPISRCSTGRLISLALLCAAACSPSERTQRGGGVPDERVVIRVWAHSGQDAERQVLQAQAGRFDRAHPEARVELTLIPEGSYHDQVQASALAGDLPDVLELDGPFVAAYAWQGHLRPLDAIVPDTLVAELLPSVVEQGTYQGRLWALGAYDSGLGLFARRSALRQVGARLPTAPHEAWTAEELEGILAALAERDDDGAPLDLHLNYRGEWYTYAFLPALRSAGGGLMGHEEIGASGILDGPPSVLALSRLQSWIERGWVDPNIDDAAFVEGRAAISWSGHWDFRRYHARWGDDVVALPLPDFGDGMRTGQGSWVWAVTRAAADPARAADWIRFVLSREEIAAMTDANAAVPARPRVAETSALYGPDGPLRPLLDALEGGWAVPRPRTPVYPFATSAFQDLMEDVRNGEDVAAAARAAARLVDREIEDNRGYPPVAVTP